jgi:hypothetical protein
VIKTNNLSFLCTNTTIDILCASMKISGEKKKMKERKIDMEKKNYNKIKKENKAKILFI